jgi:Spy/CpxP family protein refolding chaperone
MKKLLSNKSINWLIGLLLAANLFTLGFFWLNKFLPQFANDKGPKEFLIKELDLNSNQQKQYELLIEDHRKLVRDLKKRIGEERNVLYDLLKEPSQNDSALLAGANQFSLHMRDMELVHLRHFKQLRNLCDNNQKIKFDALLHQLSKIMLPNSGKDRMPPPGR